MWAAPVGVLRRSSRRRRATWGWTSKRPARGAGWHHHVAPCLLAGATLLSLQQAWGGACSRISRPQVYRVVREMLPRGTVRTG